MESRKSKRGLTPARNEAREYVLTRIERTLRIEKVRYVINIPTGTKGKLDYAEDAVCQGEYLDYTTELLDSERTDEEIRSLRILKAKS